MSGSQIQLTGQLEIASLARQARDMRFTSLNKHLTFDWLQEAYKRTRKDGASGVDGQTSDDFERDLTKNLSALLELAKSGRYVAPPVRRTYIPKGNGEMRPLGIPTFADKVLQRAVVMILEPVFEQDFLECSYGFRPGRSALEASDEVDKTIFRWGDCYVIDVDVRKYFDTIPHARLREMVESRIADGVILRLIGKWLNAGVFEDGMKKLSEAGSPQGGVISPLLANVYMHHVLDKWFEDDVIGRCQDRVKLVRYADDFVIVAKSKSDAERIYAVLGKRFDKYGLRLHEEKTRIVHFSARTGSTFNFLGFTHYWSKSVKGATIPKRKTAKDRMNRIAKKIKVCCNGMRHWVLSDQARRLNQILRGVYNYYGVTHNSRSLDQLYYLARWHWYRALRRRAQRRTLTWEDFNAAVGTLDLARPIIMNSIYKR